MKNCPKNVFLKKREDKETYEKRKDNLTQNTWYCIMNGWESRKLVSEVIALPPEDPGHYFEMLDSSCHPSWTFTTHE